MSVLLFEASSQVVGFANHVPVAPAVSSGAIMLDLDPRGEFLQGCHGCTTIVMRDCRDDWWSCAQACSEGSNLGREEVIGFDKEC